VDSRIIFFAYFFVCFMWKFVNFCFFICFFIKFKHVFIHIFDFLSREYFSRVFREYEDIKRKVYIFV